VVDYNWLGTSGDYVITTWTRSLRDYKYRGWADRKKEHPGTNNGRRGDDGRATESALSADSRFNATIV
jgi:hypothetical protein